MYVSVKVYMLAASIIKAKNSSQLLDFTTIAHLFRNPEQ